MISLFFLRISLFLFSTSFRYFGSSMAIALLLFWAGTSGEPVDLNRPHWQIGFALVPRILSLLLGLVWLSIGLCRLALQIVRADTWKQEMRSNEEDMRHRISVLEDWLVFPSYKAYKAADKVVEVRYK